MIKQIDYSFWNFAFSDIEYLAYFFSWSAEIARTGSFWVFENIKTLIENFDTQYL